MTDTKEPAPGEPPEAGSSNVNSAADDTSKPERLPWENEPHVNREAATTRAIAAAQPPRSDPNSAVVVSYARKAFDGEIARVAAEVKGARNGTLFKAAANLFELVAARALEEQVVVDALHGACLTNGSIQDDGESQFDKTIQSARRRGFDNPRDLSGVGLGGRAGDEFAAESDDEPKPTVFDDFRRLERGFWTERESLQHIYLAALSRMCSPWAVLAHVIVRALALVRPNVMLPEVIGSRGSLNFFAAVVAKSGGGKSVAEDAACDLFPAVVRQRNLGSGEGLVDSYVRPADKESGEPAGLYESVLFVADEGESLKALGSRSGATLPALLRSAFSGKQLGFAYRGNDRHLDLHSYRLTLLVNVQPAKSGVLLDDQTGGLLQRFMWFPASDQRVDSQNPDWPGPLSLPSDKAREYPRELKIPYEAIDLIKDGAVARNRGEPNPLDGHALFAREKLAFALAVLDGRDEMTADDWRLAGTAARVSDHIRQWCAEELDRARADDATQEGKTLGVKRFAADREQARRVADQRTRIARSIVDKLTAAGAEGMTVNNLARRLRSDERGLVVPTLLWLAEHGKVTKIDRQAKDRTDRWAVL